MPSHDLAGEASKCRRLAQELHGRPEAPFLHRLASEFDRIAGMGNDAASAHEDDGRYFAARAAQENTAAARAVHPKARLAHLKMAQRYEALSHELGAGRTSTH